MSSKFVKKVQSLKHKKYRNHYQLYFIEGKRILKAAIDSKTVIDKIICSESYYQKRTTKEVTKIHKNIKVISDTDFKKISSTKTPSGIAATCKIGKEKIIDYSKPKWVFLDNISDPGNLGTILRTGLWFGLKDIALSSNCVDSLNPKVLRSGMGAHFGINIYKNVHLESFKKSHKIIATATNGESIAEFNFPEKFIITFSNEAHGISEKNHELIDDIVRIESPAKKSQMKDSLNVSCAASIAMYIISSI